MNKFRYIWMAAIASVTFSGLTACDDDDDSQSTPMTVEKIFLQDAKSSVPDREVSFARLGQLIRIQGSGFAGLKKVYVNGYDTYFNNALLTDNNIWLTLNANTPTVDADEAERNIIRLVKDATETRYTFDIRSAMPSVSVVENTMPMAGETVVVRGSNLHETVKVTLPGGVEVTDITNAEGDEAGTWFSFVMPEGVTEAGDIIIEGANGMSRTPAYFNDARCIVVDFEEQDYALGSWSATYGVDDLVDDPLSTGRGKVAPLTPVTGDPVVGANGKLWATAGNGNAADDWSRMTEFIPGSTLASKAALQFDCYVDGEWDLSGQLEISLQNNLSSYGYGSANTKYNKDYLQQAYAWVPWLDRSSGAHAPFSTNGRWQTVTIPLSEFGNYTNDEFDWTLQNVIDDRNAGSYRNFEFLWVDQDVKFSDDIIYEAGNGTVESNKVYVDNFRVVSLATESVSDFNDDADDAAATDTAEPVAE